MKQIGQNGQICQIKPPQRSKGILSDIRMFFLHKPLIPTLIEFKSAAERDNYYKRILQRLGQNVIDFSILNIHKIGINAPPEICFRRTIPLERRFLLLAEPYRHCRSHRRKIGTDRYLPAGKKKIPLWTEIEFPGPEIYSAFQPERDSYPGPAGLPPRR